jgi:hypothetical protein
MKIMILSILALFLVNTVAQAAEAPLDGTRKIGFCKTDSEGVSVVSIYGHPGEKEFFVSLKDDAQRLYYADYQKSEVVGDILQIRLDLEVKQDPKIVVFIPSNKPTNFRFKKQNVRIGKETVFADQVFEAELSYDNGESVNLGCRSAK